MAYLSIGDGSNLVRWDSNSHTHSKKHRGNGNKVCELHFGVVFGDFGRRGEVDYRYLFDWKVLGCEFEDLI